MEFRESVNEVSEERLAIWILGMICVVAMLIMGVEAKEIVGPIGGGIVGYLARGDKTQKSPVYVPPNVDK